MTDDMDREMDRLKQELRRARPSEASRASGIDAAMSAFEEAFAGEEKERSGEETGGEAQGSGVAARQTHRKAADRRRQRRSNHMRDFPPSRRILSRKALLYGASSLAAGVVGLVVYVQSGGFGPYSPSFLLPGPEVAVQAPPTDGPATGKRRASEATRIAEGAARRDSGEDWDRFADSDDETRRDRLGGRDRLALNTREEDAIAAPPPAKTEQPATGEANTAMLDNKPVPSPDSSLTNAPILIEEKEAAELALDIPPGYAAAAPKADDADKRLVAGLLKDGLDAEPAEAPTILIPGGDLGGVFQEAPARDRFEKLVDNPVKRVAEAPVSTFSADVDTGAYSFLRASLNRGRLPPKDAIRIEELINYFDYAYAAPDSAEEPFRLNVAVAPTPWNADTKLLHVGIKGYQPPEAMKPNANLVFLIDVSGSMQEENKLPLAINSFKLLLDRLGEGDTISIVTYAGGVRTALEPTKASERAKILKALESLTAGGGTAGAEGLKLAYEKAAESFDKDAVNRVILATDGDFNIGFSSPDEMKAFIEKKRESGVFLSVLGFGMGNYNSHLMQSLAQNGNGVAAYIDTLAEARKALADEAGGAIIPIAKDVKIQVEFNPAVISEYRLIGYETRALRREDFKNDAVDAGDVGSGHTVTAIYEITPKGSPAELFETPRFASDEAAPIPAGGADEIAFVKLRYKAPKGTVSREIQRAVGAADEAASPEAAPQETRFAAAVAAFGQLLRGNGRLGEFDYDGVLQLAAGAKGEDAFGYRAEFMTLVRLAKSLDDRGPGK